MMSLRMPYMQAPTAIAKANACAISPSTTARSLAPAAISSRSRLRSSEPRSRA